MCLSCDVSSEKPTTPDRPLSASRVLLTVACGISSYRNAGYHAQKESDGRFSTSRAHFRFVPGESNSNTNSNNKEDTIPHRNNGGRKGAGGGRHSHQRTKKQQHKNKQAYFIHTSNAGRGRTENWILCPVYLVTVELMLGKIPLVFSRGTASVNIDTTNKAVASARTWPTGARTRSGKVKLGTTTYTLSREKRGAVASIARTQLNSKHTVNRIYPDVSPCVRRCW